MDKEDIAAITDYIMKGVYPDGLSKGEKRSMRKRCTSFTCVDGVLYHRGKGGKRRVVVCDPTERQRIMATMHSSSNGRSIHSGINVTLRKVTDFYWWRRMTEDVRSFCKSCTKCSHLFPTNSTDPGPEVSDDSHTRQTNCTEPLLLAPVATMEQKELSSTTYSYELLTALRQLYEEKICCDVILAAGGFQVSTHKLILMATSDYLKSLVMDHNAENDIIQLTNMSGLCLEPIISFLYTGSLKLSQENVFLMLAAANELGITSAVALCQQFLGLSNNDTLAGDLMDDKKTEFTNVPADLMSAINMFVPPPCVFTSAAAESSSAIQDGVVILNIKKEVPNGAVLDDLVASSSIEASKRGRPKRKPCRSNHRNSVLNNVVRDTRYNTRFMALRKNEQKPQDEKNTVSDAKRREMLMLRHKAIVKLLLETRGKHYSCYICESGFKFSSGLAFHQSSRHGIPRLDLALFRLSRTSVQSAIKFSQHCKMKKTESYEGVSCIKAPLVNSQMPAEKLRTVGEDVQSVRHGESLVPVSWHNRLFSNWAKLVKHEQMRCRRKKDCSVTSSPVFRNKCGWCAKTFLRRADLLEHRSLMHKRRKEPFPGLLRRKRVRSDWSCKEKGCSAWLRTKEDLTQHMASAHPNVFFSCPHCRYKTQVEHYLKRHLVRRHKDRYLCTICSKPYHKKFLLKVHMYNQHKVEDPTLRLHHCPHEGCGYACPGKSALQNHMQKHTVAKPYTCHICGKDFKRALSLDKHINKIHLGIRPYICDKCGTSCCDEADLKRHLLKHEKNKTYSCTKCPFSTFHKLVFHSHMFCRHQVIVDEKMALLKCNQCKFVTNKKYRYNDHMKMHQNIRDIPCPECGKSFVTQKTMRQHVVKVHKQTTQRCSFCPFKTLTAKRLQEHVSLMHDVSDIGQTSYPDINASCHSDVRLSSYPSASVCPSSYTDAVLSSHSIVGPSSYPVVQTALLADNCVPGFPTVLPTSLRCEVTNIQIPMDNGYCQYDPFGTNNSVR